MSFYSIAMATTPYRQPTATGTPGTPIGSVRFFGTAVAGIDNIAPYQSTPLRTPGTYSITAIPYNQPGASGIPGSGFSSNLVLVNQTPTPTPTPSPTAPFCPAGFTGDAQALSGTTTPCPTIVPDPIVDCSSPTEFVILNRLATFGVVVENLWSITELQQLCLGVVKTGKALQIQYGGALPQDTFKRVLISAGRTQITFIRDSSGGPFCQTNNNVISPNQSTVTCFGTGLQFVEYTAVHELGHVFVGRTGGFQTGNTYYGLIFNPPLFSLTPTPGASTGVVFDAAGGVVFGTRLDVSGNFDWVRGQRGWGSPAATPPVAPCIFQQNAFTVSDWLVTPPAPPTLDPRSQELDEAAADMFLNWVYRIIGENGFLPADANWIGISDCAATPNPTPTGTQVFPGNDRYNLMSTAIMPTLATFVPTATP
jgi:hypothetical protein